MEALTNKPSTHARLTHVGAAEIYDAYVELLKRSLLDLLGPTTAEFAQVKSQVERRLKPTIERLPGGMPAYDHLLKGVRRAFPKGVPKVTGFGRVRTVPEENRASRLTGHDYPANAMTMMGYERLTNIQRCIEDVTARDVPGDLIEAGVWRGGGTILMAALLKVHRESDRTVWVADSFAGLPLPDAERYPADAGSRVHLQTYLAVSLADVKRNFRRYGLLDDSLRFAPGWFRDTLPALDVHCWAVVRIDGDMYESTYCALEHLYPRLSLGGYVIIDDYGAVSASEKATNDYRSAQGISEEIQRIDWTGVYWRKTSAA